MVTRKAPRRRRVRTLPVPHLLRALLGRLALGAFSAFGALEVRGDRLGPRATAARTTTATLVTAITGRLGAPLGAVRHRALGALFCLAGWHNKPKEAGGLDRALRTLLDAPFGKALLTVVALGLAAYGVYSFARARDADV